MTSPPIVLDASQFVINNISHESSFRRSHILYNKWHPNWHSLKSNYIVLVRFHLGEIRIKPLAKIHWLSCTQTWMWTTTTSPLLINKKMLGKLFGIGVNWCWSPIVSHSSTIAWIWNIACTTSCENYLLVCNSHNYSTCAYDVTKQFMGWKNLESKICHT